MPFETDLSRRGTRARHLSHQAYTLRVQAKTTEEELRGLRVTRSRIKRQLDGLWKSANYAHEKSRQARYGVDSGRIRACDGRYDLLNLIYDEISDALIELQEKIDKAEAVWDQLQYRAEAAEAMAREATERLRQFAEDRKLLVARLAGVPTELQVAGAYVVRVNSRSGDKLDVYYNLPGEDPLGEGHGHVVLSFDCIVREHRPPKERVLRRTPPKPSPALFARRAQTKATRQLSVPLAA